MLNTAVTVYNMNALLWRLTHLLYSLIKILASILRAFDHAVAIYYEPPIF